MTAAALRRHAPVRVARIASVALPAVARYRLYQRRGRAVPPAAWDALRWMVRGGVASVLHGEPRVTLDVDVVLLLPREAVARLAAAFPADEFHRPPAEVLATGAVPTAATST